VREYKEAVTHIHTIQDINIVKISAALREQSILAQKTLLSQYSVSIEGAPNRWLPSMRYPLCEQSQIPVVSISLTPLKLKE
jgi:hypothetical protein